MHLKMIYKYSVNRTVQKLIVYFTNVFLCFVMFTLLLVSMFSWKFVRQGRKAVDECLNGGIEQAGLIEVEVNSIEDYEMISSFVQKAIGMDAISGIGEGCIVGRSTKGIEEVWEEQERIQKKSDEDLWVYNTNIEAFPVCNIRLQKGKMPQEYDMNEDVSLLYLGSHYTNIPVGRTYKVGSGNGKEQEYTVYIAGILEEGTNLISEEIYWNDSIVDARYIESMDDKILAVNMGVFSSRLTYTVNDGYSVKETESKLRSLGDQYGLKLRFGVLEDILDEKEKQNAYIFDTLSKMLITITVTAFFLLLCSQFAQMLDDMSYFGIFYANGASTRDLVAILRGENLLKVLVSYILAVIGVYFVIRYEWSKYQPGVENWEKAMEIYCRQTLAPVLITGVVLALLATWIPIVWLQKKTPMELIQGYKV